MRYLIHLLIGLLFIQNGVAQPADTSRHWNAGGTLSVALSQGGTRNWAPGGDRFTFAGNAFLHVFANYEKGRSRWDNMLDVNYGMQHTRVFGLVKNDDKVDFVSKWNHILGSKKAKHWSYGGFVNFRTQIADGYDYDDEVRRRISAFLAPGIFAASPGVQYHSNNSNFNLHLGPAARWVIVANRPYELAANYNVAPGDKVTFEAGALLSASLKKELLKNVAYRGRLDVFSNFKGSNPQNLDVFWTNMFYLKINKCLGAVYNIDLQYDDDTRIFGYNNAGTDTQLKSIFGLGLQVSF